LASSLAKGAQALGSVFDGLELAAIARSTPA
jgi:hypothetical protein